MAFLGKLLESCFSFHPDHVIALFLAYTMAKYGMSMCVLGMAEEFKDDGIAVNALWPKTGRVLHLHVLTYNSVYLIYIFLFEHWPETKLWLWSLELVPCLLSL